VRVAIPLTDAHALRREANRTRYVRAALALALLGALAATLRLSLDPQRPQQILAARTSPIVVLDLSWSVSTATYQGIDRTLAQLAGSKRRLGLVIFSDVAYEALPPGTPAAALRPFLRFFAPVAAHRRTLLANPWAASLSGGTDISSGLSLALQILQRDRIRNGSVLLISDLGDAPNARPRLVATLQDYIRASVPLRVVAVHPTPEDRNRFRYLLARPGELLPPPPAPAVHVGEAAGRERFPEPLAAGVLAVLLLVGLNEYACRRLSWWGGRS
jgi:hypothetical protein